MANGHDIIEQYNEDLAEVLIQMNAAAVGGSDVRPLVVALNELNHQLNVDLRTATWS